MRELVLIQGGRIAGDELQGAPDDLRTPEERPTLEQAKLWCRQLATTHYENFHVATWFLPERVRPHFESVYAYCRVSDDLGDEVASPEIGMRLLRTWGEMLDECYESPEKSRHPVFVALRETIDACELPKELFADLLEAFRQDQVLTHYRTWDELMKYSRNSANPVGRLVLLVCGYRDEERALLSDKVCTALQLANFWQDVVEDADRGRRYLPAEYMEAYRVDDGQLAGRVFTPEYAAMMRALVERTRTMLHEGGRISATVDHELAVTLNLFRGGGDAILDGIAAQGYDTLRGRPVVTKVKKLVLLGGALLEKYRLKGGAGEVRPA